MVTASRIPVPDPIAPKKSAVTLKAPREENISNLAGILTVDINVSRKAPVSYTHLTLPTTPYV